MYKKFGMIALLLASNLYAQEIEKKDKGVIKLEESTITSERYEETPVIKTAKNVTVISSEEIEKRGYKNLEESLEDIPGISFSGGNLSMRGQVPSMGNKTLIVLVDGIPQNGIDNRSFDLDFIPVEQIEKIEVLPSGGAIMYGGNATAGVINIVTKDNKNSKYWGSAGLKIGSFDEKKYNLNYGTNLTEKTSVDVKYINTKEDGYRDYEKKDLEFAEIGLKHKIQNGEIGFKYIRNERESTGSGYLTRKQYDEDRKQNESYKGKLATNKQNKYIFDLNKSLTSNLDLSAVLEYRERKYTYSYPENLSVSKGMTYYTPAYTSRIKNTDSLYTNTQLKYSYKEESNIIIGGDYSKAKVKEDYYGTYTISNPSSSSDIGKKGVYYKSYTETDFEAIGGYILNKYSFNKLIFTQGVRIESNRFDESEKVYKSNGSFDKESKTDETTTNTNYELAGNYMFSDMTSGYLSYNKVHRSPNLGEYTNWKKDKKTGEEYPKESQEVDTFEIGIKSLINNIYLSGALFYIKGDKEIMYDPYRPDDGTKGSYYNLDGKTKRIGLELSSEQYFNKLTLRQNFTYLDHEIVDGPYKGNEIPGVSNLIFGVGATYEATSQLLLNIKTNYHGEAYPINDYPNDSSKVPSYTVTNISARYDFNNGLIVSAGIDNIFNEVYCSYIIYKPNSEVYSYSPSPERTYYISAEYQF